jgi:3-deoxy-D-manno-octulosonic-acid transferase
MRFLYSLIFRVLNFLLPLGKYLGNPKIKLFAEGRINPNDIDLPQKTGLRYWFHCASLGEFEQAKPIIEKLKHRDNNCSVIVTFFSPSGYQYAKKYSLVDAILYLPLDTPKNAKQIIQKINPDSVFLIKYELWYHLLNTLFEKKIPTYLVSAVFRDKQFMFSALGGFIFKLLPRFEMIFLQDKKSYDLLKSKGLNKILLSGDTRYDRVKSNKQNAKPNDFLAHFKKNHQLLILGSSWAEEETLLYQYLTKHSNFDFKIIVAPHDISAQHIKEIMENFKAFSPVLYTEFNIQASTSNLLILNTIGHLSSAYFYADIAFIGGGFGRGLHNILEPLAFDVPVIFGPNTTKYPEANLAINAQVGFQISDFSSFENTLNNLISSRAFGKQSDFIASNAGASDKILKYIFL